VYDKLQFVDGSEAETMKKLFIPSFALVVVMAITMSALAQSPAATRQRRTGVDSTPTTTGNNPATLGVKPAATPDKPATLGAKPAATPDKPTTLTAKPTATPETPATLTAKPDASPEKPTVGPFETGSDAPAKTDQGSEEEAIIQNYNNFFNTYKLGPEDIISINVFGQERYSKNGVKIPPSGRISLALIPDGIFVNGKTVDQVAELIKKRYDEYIIDPQVSVSLDQAGSYRYSVIGEVGQPGIRLMTRRLSVTEAIAEAGGVLTTGDKKKVYVLRKQANGNLQPIPVNVSAIYRGQAPDSTYLLPGDQVIVPGNKWKTFEKLSGFLPILSFARIFAGF
jgi:polysaccharide export outer membrane protein